MLFILGQETNIAVTLFDHLVVRLSVAESRSHRSSVKIDLIRFGIDPQMLKAGPQARISPMREVLELHRKQNQSSSLLNIV